MISRLICRWTTMLMYATIIELCIFVATAILFMIRELFRRGG